jgi:hypothetical protein
MSQDERLEEEIDSLGAALAAAVKERDKSRAAHLVCCNERTELRAQLARAKELMKRHSFTIFGLNDQNRAYPMESLGFDDWWTRRVVEGKE